MQKALTVHIRILGQLNDGTVVLSPPTDAETASFAARFISDSSVRDAQQDSLSGRLPFAVRPLLGTFYMPRSARKQPYNIGQAATDHMAHAIARYGLERWRPHLGEPAESRYNLAMRSICLETFKNAVGLCAYEAIGNVILPNDLVLTRVYNHLLHCREGEKWRKSLTNPNASLEEAENAAQRQRRVRVRLPIRCFSAILTSAQRLKQRNEITESSLYQCVFAPLEYGDGGLASDDEDTATPLLHGPPIKTVRVCATPWRSACEEALVQGVERALIVEAQMHLVRGPKATPRVRLSPPQRPPSRFPRVPRGLHIDRYAPQWYNALSDKAKIVLAADTTRLTYPPIATDVTFPATLSRELRNVTDIGLALYERYSETVLPRYQLPSKIVAGSRDLGTVDQGDNDSTYEEDETGMEEDDDVDENEHEEEDEEDEEDKEDEEVEDMR